MHTSTQSNTLNQISRIAALVTAYHADWDALSEIKDALYRGQTLDDLRADEENWGHLEDEIEEYAALLTEFGDIGAAEWRDSEGPEEAMREMALCVEYRSEWVTDPTEMVPDQYRITLSVGGPALHLEGDLDRHGEVCSVRVIWGEALSSGEHTPDEEDQAALMTFAHLVAYAG